MMYLLVCNHLKQIVGCPDGGDPKTLFKCKVCACFSLVTSEWNFKDIRVYSATAKDIEIVGGGKPVSKLTRKKNQLDQMDWVGQ